MILFNYDKALEVDTFTVKIRVQFSLHLTRALYCVIWKPWLPYFNIIYVFLSPKYKTGT